LIPIEKKGQKFWPDTPLLHGVVER